MVVLERHGPAEVGAPYARPASRLAPSRLASRLYFGTTVTSNFAGPGALVKYRSADSTI